MGAYSLLITVVLTSTYSCLWRTLPFIAHPRLFNPRPYPRSFQYSYRRPSLLAISDYENETQRNGTITPRQTKNTSVERKEECPKHSTQSRPQSSGSVRPLPLPPTSPPNLADNLQSGKPTNSPKTQQKTTMPPRSTKTSSSGTSPCADRLAPRTRMASTTGA